MPTPLLLPKQGNSVESCIILTWRKQVGDVVAVGDVVCEVETDKATLEVESTAAGTLLAHFFAEGDEVAVMTTIAAIGGVGDSFTHLVPNKTAVTASQTHSPSILPAIQQRQNLEKRPFISPRAKQLAEQYQIDWQQLVGTGPNGRLIERDIQAALQNQPSLTPVAQRMVQSGEFAAPETGSGKNGRITTRDLTPTTSPEKVTVIPVKGIRKTIAQRMLASTQQAAPFTLHGSADARAMQQYRQRLKQSNPEQQLQAITLNHLIMYGVVKTLQQQQQLNAHFLGDEIHQFETVHLGFAVDTPRGLLVPVIHNAQQLSLQQLARRSRELREACVNGRITPDALTNATFTVSNLGNFGIEAFTPILNPPQVGILGVGNIAPKPVETEAGIEFISHLGLSLTVDHQAVDGAPSARFLQALAQNLANFDLLLAL
ncbi:MAG: dihydrolipoamide acetyltransferase family protein [Chloroflexota bacterium]